MYDGNKQSISLSFSKVDTINDKADFLRFNLSKLLTRITGNSLQNCDFFFKFVIYVKGDCCDYWPLEVLTAEYRVSTVVLLSNQLLITITAQW